jgi:ADP-dependent NAD(P)H-hydrate dehydratase / NAD(P)H-hydrate epimerase
VAAVSRRIGPRAALRVMILSCDEMRTLEERAFSAGFTAETLMEEAGAQAAVAVRQFFPAPGVCVAVFGKGHNGGDALVAARRLAVAGWETHLAPAFPEGEWSALTRRKYAEAGLARQHAPGKLPQIGGRPLVVLDGLLGIGAKAGLRDPVARMAREINALRETANAQVFALDLPTGLDADSGEADPNCVTADWTLTIGFAKRGLLADSATRFVGRLAVLPLAALSARLEPRAAEGSVATAEMLAPLLPRRSFDSHKGQFGRVGIVAGSRGLTGAAIMAAEACVRAGAGLVSLYVTEDIHAIVAGATSPEVMVRPVRSYCEMLEVERDVLALGPGLGQTRRGEVLELIRLCEQPAVIDADGLNLLAGDLPILGEARAPRLLTPHPGEMERLAPGSKARARAAAAADFVAKHPVTLLLKGSRTIVAEAGHPLSFNTTGNAGMATGGMGDALTGVCAALMGQGLPAYHAARAGAWICGRAAELAISHGGESEESLSAARLIAHLGGAFRELRARSL